MRDAIRIQQHRARGGSLRSTDSLGLLGVLLTRKGNYPAADSVWQAIRRMEAQVGQEHRDLRRLYGWLADLYQAWDRPTEAASYRTIARPLAPVRRVP